MLSHCPLPPYPAKMPGNAPVVASKRRYTRFRYYPPHNLRPRRTPGPLLTFSDLFCPSCATRTLLNHARSCYVNLLPTLGRYVYLQGRCPSGQLAYTG